MMLDAETTAVAAVLFCSTFVRSSFGFGDALLAMPLLTMLIGLRTATPLVALVAATIAVSILLRHWRDVRLRSAWRLVVASAAGIPLGLWFLAGAHEAVTSLALGAIILAYAGYSLFRPRALALDGERWAYAFGFAGGVLGGAYNVNGPPAVIYGTLRRWAPATFRATLQGYLLLSNALIIAGHGSAGLWTAGVARLYLGSLPAVVAGILLGEWVGRALPPVRFSRLVYALLAAAGLVLLVRTLARI